LNQFSQEDDLHTNRCAIDEHEQARLSLDTHAFHEDSRRKDEKQKVSCSSDEEEEEEVDDAWPQRETNSVEAALMAKTSQRLLAYKKEGKSWEWIFRRFPGTTRPAIRTRWNMVRPRADDPALRVGENHQPEKVVQYLRNPNPKYITLSNDR
jgi:hypothetical protein